MDKPEENKVEEIQVEAIVHTTKANQNEGI